MLSGWLSLPSLTVGLVEDQVFVHPLAAGLPGAEPTVRGTATLSLPARRALKTVTVVLEGIVDACGGVGWPYETTKAYRKEVVQELKGEMLSAGKHGFNFSFVLPSSVAISQRSNHGRVRYHVKASVDFHGGMLSASIASAPAVLWVTANPSPPTEQPSPLFVSIQDFSEDLGPVGLTICSPHFTVASLCSLRFSLLGPPQPVTILSVEAVILQSFQIDYTHGRTARPPAKEYPLLKVDSKKFLPSGPVAGPSTSKSANLLPVSISDDFPSDSAPSSLPSYPPMWQGRPRQPDQEIPDPFPLVQLSAGQEYEHMRILRVPNDDLVRGSTLEETETPIRVSHVLQVEVRYKVGEEGEETVLRVGKPVTIASCCCLLEILALPSYANPPKTVIRPNENYCTCRYGVKELMERDGEALLRSGPPEPTVATAPPPRGGDDGQPVDPRKKTPAYTAKEQQAWIGRAE
ncbi:hypothetical protein JCM8547_000143 [Rhodosporidiobolus lusitaniae]